MQSTITQFLSQSLIDNKLDVDEKHELYQLLLTLNVDEKRFLRNKAFAMVRDQIEGGADVMRMLAWLEKVAKLTDKSYVIKPVDTSAYFSPGEHCRDAIIDLLDHAQERVDICVFTISDNYITDAIHSAYQRGVLIRIITDNDKANDRGSDVYSLQQKGVSICMDTSPKHMHHKFALIDSRLINGSFNWTRSATVYNQENIVVTNHDELLNEFSAIFEKLWLEFGG